MHCLLTLLDYDPPEEEGDGDDARDPRTAGGGAEVAGSPRGGARVVLDRGRPLRRPVGWPRRRSGPPATERQRRRGGTAAAAAGRGGPGGSRRPRDPSPRERLSRASRRPPPASFADSFSWFGGLEDRLGVASRGPGGGGRAPLERRSVSSRGGVRGGAAWVLLPPRRPRPRVLPRPERRRGGRGLGGGRGRFPLAARARSGPNLARRRVGRSRRRTRVPARSTTTTTRAFAPPGRTRSRLRWTARTPRRCTTRCSR